jgi:adenine C2-methylase RlmN of 23S rRNA A2503 and tRNA A37
MNDIQTLNSELDESVNFVRRTDDGGNFESRFVTRGGRHITVYLSSHSGCVKGCLFCHLTGESQTFFLHASKEDYLAQAEVVLEHFTKLPEAKKQGVDRIYFSFMARGEPLANKTILSEGDSLFTNLSSQAAKLGLLSRHCVSTIFPKEMVRRRLGDVFPASRPVIYYSLYSLDQEVRKKWLPQAMDPVKAIEKLTEWSDLTLVNFKIHGAIIQGINDDLKTWDNICELLRKVGANPSFNLVHYNPASDRYGKPGNIELVKNVIDDNGFDVKIKSRVGFDVKASCGMFVPASKIKGGVICC